MVRVRDASIDVAVEATLVASRALVAVAARSLATAEGVVTLPQYRALVLLNTRGAMNVGALADGLAIHRSSATRLCDRLIAKGVIQRASAAENRREVTLTLSPSGRALVRSVTNRRAREIAKILDRLDPDARRVLIRAFEAFAGAAGEVPADAWKLGWSV
jgi:DNA-binding MarR family transcriptional regulator